METPHRLNFQNLSPVEREQFESFAEKQFRCCLDGKDPYEISNASIVAVGSLDVGLALASVHPIIDTAVIHSIHAKDGSAEQYKALLTTLEKELCKAHATVATFSFFDDGKLNSPLATVLNNDAWEEPELSMLKYFFDGFTFNPPWLNTPPKFPKVVRKFPWKKLTPNEKKVLLHKLGQGRIPLNISPFGMDENLIEPLNSLGLRYKREVIGWCVTQRTAEDTIKYAFLYMDPEFLFIGNPVRLLADSIHIQTASTVQWAEFDVNIDQSSLSWLNFVEKRLAPYAQREDKIYKTWKNLKDSIP